MTRRVSVDTSAWIDHLKAKTGSVTEAGQSDIIELVAHSMVIAELHSFDKSLNKAAVTVGVKIYQV